MASSSSSMSILTSFACLILLLGTSNAQLSPLSPTYYLSSCPQVFTTVRSVVESAIEKEARMGASLTRLFFHDCFVNGCDGSILLDDTANFTGEKSAGPNKDGARGFDVVDEIKSAVEKVCPGVVSCADVLAIAARDSVNILGGPSWSVKLGRRDARNASLEGANSNLPRPALNLTDLISAFAKFGLSAGDLVALSGAHNIGQARCFLFRARIYNETNIDATFAKSRQANCPIAKGSGDDNLAPLDYNTPTSFDNHYFKALLEKKGLLHSDQQLFSGGPTDSLVMAYSSNLTLFNVDFVNAMIKMGDIMPLTGSAGEIRKNCRMVN